MPTGDDRAAKLRVILDDIGPDCQRCKLAKLGRKQIVFGTGDPQRRADVHRRRPGRGRRRSRVCPSWDARDNCSNNMITAMGLKREQVYIANIVKCRPPGNRTPERDECDTCSPFLMRQIRVVRPKVIVALGATAAKNLLGVNDSMASLRGRFYDFSPKRALTGHRRAFRLQAGGHLPSGVLVARSAAEGRGVERPADGDEVSGTEVAGKESVHGFRWMTTHSTQVAKPFAHLAVNSLNAAGAD